MKNIVTISFAAVIIFLLMGCNSGTKSTSSSQEDNQDIAMSEADIPAEQVVTEDIAQNVLKLIERSLIPSQITEQELNEAMNTARTFDEYTTPMRLDIVHSDDGEYNIAYINCYPMADNKSYYVLMRTEAGVDGAVLEDIKTYIYRDGILIEEDVPFKIPTFNEFFSGIEIPEILQPDLNMFKKMMAKQKNFSGFDLRVSEQDDAVLQFRPSYIFSDELYELAKPVEYQFNGNTFVRM